MFCRNIIEFPLWKITSTRYALHCSTSHAKFMKNFGVTFAKDMTYRALEICRDRNESTFRQNIDHSEAHCKQEHQDILYIQNASSSTSMTWQLYSTSIFIIDIYNTLSFGYSHLEVLRGRRWGRLRG